MMALTQESKASHAMGADLTYSCIGGNSYRVRVTFYRDCIGISAPANVNVAVNSASCGQSLNVICTPIPGTGQEVTPMCPSAQSTCSGGTFTGIQEWIYEGVINLPMQCPDWIFSYSLCCRNAAINTITSPGSSTFYIYATLNNTISPCNSSPTFSNKPVPFVCQGQQFCFNHGAFDVDGDSLVYELITPYQTASTTVNYIGPYNANNPLNSSPALSFNTATGDFCMTPQAMQVTVMAVLVKEYRNGVLIGTVERDIQITVLNCVNNNPSLTGINGTSDFDTTICANTPLCFDIFSNDPDAGQNLTVTWNNAITGATFSSTAASHPTSTFCWTPSAAQISSTPYCFTARVRDDACPYIGSQIYSYCITVKGISVDAGPDQVIACNDLATISATVTSGTGPFTFLWSNGSTMQTQTVGTGTYIVTVSDGTCQDMDTINVLNTNIPTAQFTYSNSCINQPIVFTDQSIVPGGIITSWSWDFGDGSSSSASNPTHQYSTAGNYNVCLVITTSLGCIDTSCTIVSIQSPPVASFTAPSGCVGTTINFSDTSTPSASITSWNWNFGNGSTSNQQNPTTTYNTPGTYSVSLVVGNAAGCVDTITQNITINPQPTPSFTYTNACQNSNVTFTAGGNWSSMNWTFGDGSTSAQSNPVHTYPGTGTYTVTLTVTDSLGCTNSISQLVNINPPPTITAGPDISICQGQVATLSASGGVSYVWSPGGTGNNIVVSPGSNTTYIVTGTDPNGCSSTDTIQVTVNPNPVINAGNDVSICQGASATLTASGGVTYTWMPTGSSGSSITVSPGTSTSYAVTGTNAFGCSATDFVDVIVNANPTISLPANHFACSGSTISLNAGNPGSSYQWSTGASSQTINIGTQGIYTVTVTTPQGCTATASTNVTVGNNLSVSLGNYSFCSGSSVNINAGYPGSTYQWSNGATSQSITVSTPGTYSVTITEPNGCSGSASANVSLQSVPQADFTATSICVGSSTQFMDASGIAGGSITTWSWNFGDGNFSSQQNPTHTYVSAGNYTVSLIISSANGCIDTVIKTINVYPQPVAQFVGTDVCLNNSVSFSDQSNAFGGNINSWQWWFGNGSTSTQQNPSNLYSSAGVYQVSLVVTTVGGCKDSTSNQITVHDLPNASFNAANVCLGTPIVFNNSSTISSGSITSSNWNFGNGNGSSLNNPSYSYTSAGTYPVTLIVTTNQGCKDTAISNVQVYSLPAVDAGSNQSICLGSSATLTASGASSYSWSTGSTQSSITVSPTNNTWYVVTGTNSNGCIARDSARVFVNQMPLANAGTDQDICTGSSTNLNATGGGTYLWSNGATTQTINISPVSTTAYTVTVTLANGCSRADTVLINVHPIPITLASPDTSLCNGSTIALSASGANTYYWSPTGQTSQTIYVNPSVSTNYVVEGISSFGCRSRDTVLVQVLPVPQVSLSNAFICGGFTATLNAGNPGSTYVWGPYGDTTQAITVATAGTYEVWVTGANGCTGYGSAIVSAGGTVISNPVTENICIGDTASLNAGNPGSTFLWSNGATTQSINTAIAGNYTVTITNINGCTGTVSNRVNTHPYPASGFYYVGSCLNPDIAFYDTSKISSGNIASWMWDFGDGYNSSMQSPIHMYTNTGIFNVSLTVTSGYGCATTANGVVGVSTVPQANFIFSSACEDNQILFNDQSSISAGSIVGWNWTFGNGLISNIQNPSTIYGSQGIFYTSLVVTSDQGCEDSIAVPVQVFEIPQAQFASANVCFGDTSVFTDQSMINSGSIVSYLWSFGDGASSSAANPSHLYALPGLYVVELIVTSSEGCSDTVAQNVVVYPSPSADFTVSNACLNSAVLFNNTSVANAGSLSSFFYTFGDGGFSNQQHPSYLYSASGIYPVTLTISSSNGCIDSITKPVSIFPLPVADFRVLDNCINSPTSFTDLSYSSGCAVQTWLWKFGDGNTSQLQNPIHNYAASGTFNVTLIVSTCNGCSDSISMSVNIWPAPQVSFSSANVCFGDSSLFFNNTGISGGGSGFNYNWQFGNGISSNAANPVHYYNSAGTYNVTLTATSSNGCSASATQATQVYYLPQAAFVAPDVCEDQGAEFFDNSNAVNGSLANWSWDFGDGSNSSAQNPIHQYSGPGTYPVNLLVSNSYGCYDQYLDSITIITNVIPVLTAQPVCDGDAIAIAQTNSPSNVISWVWFTGDGNVQNDDSLLTYIYANPGSYTVTLETTNSFGCKASSDIVVEVHPLPDPNFDVNNGCEGSSILMTNTSTIPSGSIASYTWNFGDGSPLSNATSPSYSYSQAGVYTITLTAISDQGCVDSISKSVIIFESPDAGFVADIFEGCAPVIVRFTDTSYTNAGAIIGWLWSFGDGGISTLQHPVHQYNQSGTYTVSLTVTNTFGCTSSYSMPNTIEVYPYPEADFYPDPEVTNILNPTIQFNNLSQGGLTYNWFFGDNENSTAFEPSHTYGDTGTYMVMLVVVNAYGCPDTIIKPIRIDPIFSLWVPNAFTPNSDGNNDFFTIYGEGITGVDISIFNRWGAKIYSTSSLSGWDGSVIGEANPAVQDVYVYDISVQDVFGRTHQKVGKVTLVR